MPSNSDSSATRTVDVRTVDGEPFSTIMGALDALEDDDTLVVINSFEPEPLYGVLDRRGFAYETNQVATEEWQVRIEPK